VQSTTSRSRCPVIVFRLLPRAHCCSSHALQCPISCSSHMLSHAFVLDPTRWPSHTSPDCTSTESTPQFTSPHGLARTRCSCALDHLALLPILVAYSSIGHVRSRSLAHLARSLYQSPSPRGVGKNQTESNRPNPTPHDFIPMQNEFIPMPTTINDTSRLATIATARLFRPCVAHVELASLPRMHSAISMPPRSYTCDG